MVPNLMRHQVEDIAWHNRVLRGLLGNEPGLGKSRSAIEATKGCDNVLVVAPAMALASGVWETQLELWSDNPSRYMLVPYSLLAKRVKTWTGGRASSTRPIPAIRDELKQPWDALIIDESHYIKNRDAIWTELLERQAKRTPLVLPMTGTPIPNWSHELFTTLRILFPEESKPGERFGSFWRWAEEWFDTTPTRWSSGQKSVGKMLECTVACFRLPRGEVCEHYKAFTEANLGPHYRRVFRRDVIDLPPLTEETVHTPLSPWALKQYRKMKKDFSATVDGETVVAWNQGAKNVMLDKFTVSPWLLNPTGPPRGGKFDQLELDLSQRSRATLVVAHHRDVVAACAEVSRRLGLVTGEVHGGTGTVRAGRAIRDFVGGGSQVLVGSLELVAEGHTMTNADMVIFVERSWKSYRNEQAMFRIHRLGQQNPCTVRRYITPGTVDANKERVLREKTEDQIRFMTAAEYTSLL